jgi:hypothetical protein
MTWGLTAIAFLEFGTEYEFLANLLFVKSFRDYVTRSSSFSSSSFSLFLYFRSDNLSSFGMKHQREERATL